MERAADVTETLALDKVIRIDETQMQEHLSEVVPTMTMGGLAPAGWSLNSAIVPTRPLPPAQRNGQAGAQLGRIGVGVAPPIVQGRLRAVCRILAIQQTGRSR